MNDRDPAIGRQEIADDVADPARVAGLAALLDHAAPPWRPGTLPPLGHWLLFPPQVRQSLLGGDGHPHRGAAGLLPAVDLPRRMWAGSRVRFLAAITLGAALRRTSTLVAATPKAGRSGAMLFATVRHEIHDGATLAIVEEQDIVYREAAAPGAITPRATGEVPGDAVARTIVPDPVLLFRYSALTFNGHRIHYDRDYARQVEGYPGLVVHGPLIATLLLDLLLRRNPGAEVTGFTFRASAPAFDGEPLTLGFARADDAFALHAVGPHGVTTAASATLERSSIDQAPALPSC